MCLSSESAVKIFYLLKTNLISAWVIKLFTVSENTFSFPRTPKLDRQFRPWSSWTVLQLEWVSLLSKRAKESSGYTVVFKMRRCDSNCESNVECHRLSLTSATSPTTPYGHMNHEQKLLKRDSERRIWQLYPTLCMVLDLHIFRWNYLCKTFTGQNADLRADQLYAKMQVCM